MRSKSKIPIDCQKTFSRYVRLLGCIGLNFLDESQSRMPREYLKFLLFSAVTFLPFTGVQFSLIFKIDEDNFLEGSRCVPLAVVFVLGIIKMIIASTKHVQIRETLVEIGELWPKDLNDDYEKAAVYKDWLKRMGFLFNLDFTYVLSTLTLFVIGPLLNTFYNIYTGVDEYVLPYQIPEWWKCESIFIFFLTYIWEVISTVPMLLFLYLPFDLLLITITSDISLLFRLLQIDLENAIEVSDDAEVKAQLHILDDGSYQRIKTVIMTHQKLLRLADNVSDIFGPVIFVHMASSTLLICFNGFLTAVYGGLAETIANLFAAFSCTTTIFLLSFVGQLLSDTSSDIAEAAYKSAWYESNNKVKNLIKMIILRAQRPSYLSALGFSDLTLRSFSKIMSTAWTYFTLLIQLYSGK